MSDIPREFDDFYYRETPQERHTRHHEEDKRSNPERHYPLKEIITREESLWICPWCSPDWSKQYQYDAKNDRYVRVTDNIQFSEDDQKP